MKNPIWIIWLVLCLSACGSRTPDYVISEKDMEDLLVDIHKSEAVIESNSSTRLLYGMGIILKPI